MIKIHVGLYIPGTQDDTAFSQIEIRAMVKFTFTTRNWFTRSIGLNGKGALVE